MAIKFGQAVKVIAWLRNKLPNSSWALLKSYDDYQRQLSDTQKYLKMLADRGIDPQYEAARMYARLEDDLVKAVEPFYHRLRGW
ncbi:hypothetical protein [Microvirga tunisiensis]|uniref:Uncharacterized protein n=1 Tax=Microvirga tunisiensis TaxID=2108360 RepID=A0A5N7MHH7_9HYPH|nr:hypothetical protein [Microvirga tunisiensis]MPR08032.1 hypothetical protein [Microvirga tunisiensis]MPR26343.1 hypothetical protein [Microvirga tunisiensis]